MSAGGVIPPLDERLRQYVQTGDMNLGDADLIFGAEGHRVIIQADQDIVLTPGQQDVFVRQLFRAITLAEQGTGPVEAPF